MGILLYLPQYVESMVAMNVVTLAF